MNKLLMTHLYYGDPGEEFSQKLAQTLVDSGADILEIGIPYTDPVCDGEVFQHACFRALKTGVNPFKVLEGIKKLKNQGIRKPIYLTSYYGPIFNIGEERFVKLAEEAGVKGLIVPDILLEEQESLQRKCKKNGLSLIQFATVYSCEKRLKEIVEASTDYIYCIALPGVTGESVNSLKFIKLVKLIKLLKILTDRKIYVGYGIKSKKEANDILKIGADGIIVGSAIARIYEKNIDNPYKTLPGISKFIKGIKESTIEGESKKNYINVPKGNIHYAR